MSYTVTRLPAPTLNAIGRVGETVTYANQQYRVYAVEGVDYFAFASAPDWAETVCDFDMTRATWITEPVATLLPVGAWVGQGQAITVPLRFARKGVCLAKRA